MSGLRLYAVLLVAYLVIDGLWLAVIAQGFYDRYLGYLLADEPNLLAAALFYPIFVLAIQVFVVRPGLDKGSFRTLLLRAFFFGFTTYATYDLTNLATIAGWPWQVTVVDVVWGGTLSTLVSLVGFVAARRFNW